MDILIKHYLTHSGRALEQARFAYWFEKGSKEAVIDALKSYQNADGGFGHGLEPDFLNPNSNPIDTWTACNILEEIAIDTNHEMMQRLLGYLLRTPHKENWHYYFRIPSNNDYPHAPWWHYTMDNAIEGYNPSASLLGFLFKHLSKENDQYELITKALNKAIEYFIENDVEEMHELRCFNELYRYTKNRRDNKAFRRKLRGQNLRVLARDTTKWFTTYCTRPSQLFIAPDVPGAKEASALIDKEIQLMIKNRNQEGVFDINWSWEQYEEHFRIAKRQWMGIIAFETLKRAHLFNINTKL